ncbi:hypothetical protein OAJ16_00310 [Deltaproteobacteria bacterium]|nr:hypothetical protein [Deltaproteobacteria bacterium]
MKVSLLEGRKVALVHDWLIGMRGGEKCLEVLVGQFQLVVKTWSTFF